MEIHIGLTDMQRHEIAGGLSKLLADSYTLYVKTHNFHWNVTGPNFAELHKMFEKQYLDLANAVDDIAERIRALGEFAPASYTEFQKLTSVKEETGHPKAEEMIEQLMLGQEEVIQTARKIFKVVDPAHDEPTADLLTTRMNIHEKNAWMLRSLLEH